MKRIILICAVFLFSALNCRPDNRSVAIVGNKTILESDIKAKMAGQMGYDEALKELMIEKMLSFQAEKEGIKVTPGELDEEISRIKKGFKDEKSFMESLVERNISYLTFKNTVEERLKTNKLVRQKIVGSIEMKQSEILRVMKDMESSAGNLYTFSLKWFGSEEDGKDFVECFEPEKEKDMSPVEGIKPEELLPEVLSRLMKMQEGDLSAPFKVNERYLVVLLKEVRNDRKFNTAELFARARNIIYQKQFNEKFDLYIKELQSSIPVFYSE